MSNIKKLMMTAAGGETLNVENMFSTYLYTGDGTSSHTITNGVDYTAEDYLVWIKDREYTGGGGEWHQIYDTVRGATKILASNTLLGEYTESYGLKTFNNNGFTLGQSNAVNRSGSDIVAWSFRKAPKFFDVVTYTGNGTAGRSISHNLGTTVGMLVIKRRNNQGGWHTWHRSDPSKSLRLDTQAEGSSANAPYYFGNGSSVIAPTSTSFTVGGNSEVNGNGDTFVAYLFAHNNNDGGFGINGDQDIIKCGSYSGNGSGEYDDNGTEVNLGFEPQWILIKSNTWGSGDWQIYDTMRGIGSRTVTNNRDNATDKKLVPNKYDAEANFRGLRVTPTGFKMETDNYSVNGGVHDYVYVAIRRGPMAIPENGTDVFTTAHRSAGEPGWESGFPVHQPVDFAMYYNNINTAHSKYIGHRHAPAKLLITSANSQEQDANSFVFDYNDGWNDNGSTTTNYPSHMWSRAPNFFDMVVYTGDGTTGRTVDHNLGVAPEMMWVKKRSTTANWQVYHSSQGATKYSPSFRTDPFYTAGTGRWNNTTPTATQFTLGNDSDVNGSGSTYVAFLFSSLDGVSKIGSYSGTGSTINVDCGFSSGARWIMIKRADAEIQSTTHWYVFDTLRGIVTGNDPYVMWNNVTAQVTNTDYIDPYSSGFTVTSSANSGLNASGGTYIYYAIA